MYLLLITDIWLQHIVIYHSHSSRVSTYNLNVNFKNTIVICSNPEQMRQRGRWVKPKVPYNERRCTLCNNPDVQNEFYITLCCAKFNSLREKYIKPYYYRRPSVDKDLDKDLVYFQYSLVLQI